MFFLIFIIFQCYLTCSTWSTGRSVSDGWPTNDNSDLPDGKEPWPSSQPSQGSSSYTDLVPEFEPGKPWKVCKSLLPLYICQ